MTVPIAASAAGSRLLTVQQASQLLGVPAPTLYRWIGQDMLPALHLGPSGRTKRIPLAVIEKIKSASQHRSIERTLRLKRWFTPTRVKPRVATAATDAEVMATVKPRTDTRVLDRLRKLEQRYQVSTIEILMKDQHGNTPVRVPKDVANSWLALAARMSIATRR